MVEAVQHRACPDQSDRSRTRARRRPRRLQLQRAVRPVAVVVPDVLGQDRAQVPLVNRDDVVEAVAPEGADHPLGDGVGLKRQLPLVPTVRDGFASRTPSTRCAASALSC